ncbi:hypothetical protein [Amycolatopsis sp. H20-H5]|uniref:hypothetical protein n=1 Tax=Amycolatopsis sp. H20-H5 TaxID=3046309 RepID=UPI002DBB914D|nr:hypothetical protein [Amycolatopsis sp. H20-H5]MEC3976969.1 hypothetical protein [Amycolatopsis sp. H20-H5]
MFDLERLTEAIAHASDGRGNATYYAPVSYANQPPNEAEAFAVDIPEVREYGEDTVFRAHQEKFLTVLYFQQSIDWAPEREFRRAVLDPEESELLVDITQCLSGVIFGEVFPVSAIKMVSGILEEHQGVADRNVLLSQ